MQLAPGLRFFAAIAAAALTAIAVLAGAVIYGATLFKEHGRTVSGARAPTHFEQA